MTAINTLYSLNSTKALVVDDVSENRMMLSSLLNKMNYTVIEALNGQEAVDLFISSQPDIIFMGVKMPIMDGLQATREIKALSKDNFIPIIFITALGKDEDMEACIASGGDDFLTKPIDLTVLKLKILTLERISDIHRRVNELNESLKIDNYISDDVFKRTISSRNSQIKPIKTWFKTAGQLNNDLYFIKRTPGNGLNILLGNFNTQGPITAVSTLSCSEVFRTMTEKGFSPSDLLDKLNIKLIDILPTDIHLSAVFINISQDLNHIKICNLNMPDIYLTSNKNRNIKETIQSENKYLGNDREFSSKNTFTTIETSEDNRLVVAGNGVLNCQNNPGNKYSAKKYLESVKEGIRAEKILEIIQFDLSGFIKSAEIKQPLSIIEIPFIDELLAKDPNLNVDILHNQDHKKNPRDSNDCVELTVTVSGKNLQHIDPVPILINFVKDITSIANHQEALYTIFTELYVNALDHGILGLESDIKNKPNGFLEYFEKKETLIKTVNSGFVTIKLSFESDGKQNQLNIFMEDSGPGFDFKKKEEERQHNSNLLSGRGITLVDELCDSFEYHHTGNQSTSIYVWPVE